MSDSSTPNQKALASMAMLVYVCAFPNKLDETSAEGGELPHCIKGRGKIVELIRKTGPEDHRGTVN
jgi:hypothetical protein